MILESVQPRTNYPNSMNVPHRYWKRYAAIVHGIVVPYKFDICYFIDRLENRLIDIIIARCKYFLLWHWITSTATTVVLNVYTPDQTYSVT